MTARPLVTVQSLSGENSTVTLPYVLVSPVRSDVVHQVFKNMNKNHRQAYAATPMQGHDYSAISWGTGRAVSRIPRIQGSGTHRSGQGAFGNMCRGGRMFGITKTYRKWHRKIAKGQRRYAVCSALAATAIAPLVMARGHSVNKIAEVPLVIADADLKITKTKEAVALLQAINAFDDVQRVKDSRSIRRGTGKARNRRYVQRLGPLIVHTQNSTDNITLAFRNIPGVDLVNVTRLNLLQLAPGGHLGRFVIWTESAFKALDGVFGTRTTASTQKTGFKPPRAIMTNADLQRIINSSEVQSVLRAKGPTKQRKKIQKKNPLTNFGARVKLNPFALTVKRRAILQQAKGKTARKSTFKASREGFLALLNEPAVAPLRGEAEYPTKY
eukprot:TRINITY_DN8669_c0_g1_i1.p2 TRINITY_DN8669_c0_g1~~TRINITY_DN8669_c0_g1_i1.p2  ORF type:complete len:391 (-),score=92.59 TRINITY_DN8669_c0_g1_i1:60-1211(-)